MNKRLGGISIGLLWGAVVALIGSVFTVTVGNINKTDAQQDARIIKVEEAVSDMKVIKNDVAWLRQMMEKNQKPSTLASSSKVSL